MTNNAPAAFVSLPLRAMQMLERARGALAQCQLEEARAFPIEPSHLWVASADRRKRLLAEIENFSPKGTRAIYYLIASDDLDLEACRRAFREEKKKSKRRLSRCDASPSRVFYVGSSENLKKRIKEHLGFGNKATYALHLSSWAREVGLSLMLHCATYAPVIQAAAAQALEDALWDEMLPMFGRRGAR